MPPIDQNYQYNDKEVKLILMTRISKALGILRRTPDRSCSIVVLFQDARHLRLLLELELERRIDRNNYAREILIPYRIGLNHWVGVHIKIDNDGKVSKAVFLSSLTEDADTPSNELEKQAFTIVEEAISHVHDYRGLVKDSICKQSRVQDSIVFAIENLVFSYLGGGKPQNAPNGNGCRVCYKTILNSTQDNTSPTDPVEIRVTSVSDEVEDLVNTLKKLNVIINGDDTRNIKGYFIEPKSKVSTDLAKLHSEYRTVYNQRTKRLELQLNKMHDNRHVAEFTRRMPLHISMSRAAVRYINISGVGVIGGGAAGVVGGALIASVDTIAGGAFNFGRASLLFKNPGVFFTSPAFIVPVVVGVVAGGTYEYTGEQVRIFGRVVKEAYVTYLETNKGDQRLNTAAKKLENELGIGVDGKWRLSILLRDFRLYDSQIVFANILLAKIYAKQGNSKCYSMFKEIGDKFPGKKYEAMCLVGLIDIYSDPVRWKLSRSGAAMNENEREDILRETINKLNENHVQFIKSYFAFVMHAYAKVFAILTNASVMRSSEEFEEDLKTLNELTTMPNLQCMRFMQIHEDAMISKPVGKIAEVVFTFVQALKEVMLAENVKYQHIALGTSIIPNTREYEAVSRLVTNAAYKLRDSRKLITVLKLDEKSDSNEHDVIISIIKEYIDRYEERNKHFIERKNLEEDTRDADNKRNDLQINLSEHEREQILDGTFRNSTDVTLGTRDMARRLVFV